MKASITKDVTIAITEAKKTNLVVVDTIFLDIGFILLQFTETHEKIDNISYF